MFYFDDEMYLASNSPGPGQYNPHDCIQKPPNRLRYNEEDSKKISPSKSPSPDPGTYHPFHSDGKDFGKMLYD